MTFKALLSEPQSLLTEFDFIDHRWRQPYQRYKLVFQDVSVEDVLFQRRIIAKKIAKDIAAEQYRYQPVQGRVIRVGNKHREVYPLMLSDYVVQRVIYRFLADRFDPLFSTQLFSYRQGYSAHQAVSQLVAQLKSSYSMTRRSDCADYFVYQTDLSNYTDSIAIDADAWLWKIIDNMLGQAQVDDLSVYEQYLLQAAIVPEVVSISSTRRTQGVPMGSPLTSLVANCYLSALDHQVSACQQGFYCRYGDDICFMHQDEGVVLQQAAIIRETVQSLGLSIHPQKEKRIYLTAAGKAPSQSSSFVGSSVINLLGYAVSAQAQVSLKKGKIKETVSWIRGRIKTTVHLFRHSGRNRKIHAVCDMVNALLLGKGAWLQEAKIHQRLRKISDRERLRQVDYLIAFEIAKAITGIKSVKAFRHLPYRQLRHRYGLKSVIVIRDKEAPDESR